VPTLGLYGGLRPEDWHRWGQFTTFKSNASALLSREVRADQVVYCSPLVDPYQPAEETECQMPALLDCLLQRPPRVFVVQTRGPLILRDVDRLVDLSKRAVVRVSFSLTTNREDVRRLYEPHCVSFPKRLDTMARLADAGIAVYAALAPLLPCDPEALVESALAVTRRDLIGDPLHVRQVKPCGATTREAALRISEAHGFTAWHDPAFQEQIVERISSVARAAGFRFATGPGGFAMPAAAAEEGARV
jgi:DNA repair photolyase